MSASFKKRFLAYLIDVLILNVILSFISFFIPVNDNLVNLNNELINIDNSYISSEISIETYINRYADVVYDIDKELFISNLLSCVFIICYFIVYPLYNKGMTFGKKLIGIRIVKNDDSEVDANGLIIRYLFMEGLGVSILSLCLLFILKNIYYVGSISILGFLQFLVVIISIFMVLYRRDKRSLPDLIAGTKVIEVK